MRLGYAKCLVEGFEVNSRHCEDDVCDRARMGINPVFKLGNNLICGKALTTAPESSDDECINLLKCCDVQ